jgi:2-oxoglutarate ferredoxin oxidoreductase subunit alpha
MTEKIVNNFCITFSTINGSGSATANTTILRALFKMGIPVTGKNIFPSNIQGLPTWYSIRLSSKGYRARLEKDDIVIAMNPATLVQEYDYILPGGVLFYPDDIQLPTVRDDITIYPMPIKAIISESDTPAKLRDYAANMIYVGVLAQMIGIDQEKIHGALDFHFKGKKNAVEANFELVNKASKWASENLKKVDPYFVEPMDGTSQNILAEGNVAAALGSIFGGVQFVGWYPITPATSLAESLNEYLPQLRKDPVTGKDTYVVIQAEDELAAIGMVVGAGWAGLRSMTSTSGPGLSLMAEYLGLAYYTETPVVVWDVQRVGPSTGLPTRTAQSDLSFANFISHGDKQYIILLPGSVDECFEFGWKAFDIAERFQTPVLVLIDLDLGMNNWMCKPFAYPDKLMDRGKILWEKEFDEFIANHNGKWGRYWDVDGDGIPYRTLPGNARPGAAFFSRGTGHDEFTKYSEEPEVWQRMMDRVKSKIDNSADFLPEPLVCGNGKAKIGLITFGSNDPAVDEVQDLLSEKKIETDYMRIRALPVHSDVRKFIESHDQVYVIENNRDSQMWQILVISLPEMANKLKKIAHCDGLPLTARWIENEISHQEGEINE